LVPKKLALRFRVLGNRVLGGIFGHKREEGSHSGQYDGYHIMERDRRFFRNVGGFLPVYMASHLRRE
jgi:hypothetical protein